LDLRGPTAVIGGAQKSATTSLFLLLEERPDVATPANKEPQFFAYAGTNAQWNGPRADEFARTVVTDEGEYRRLFAHGQHARHRIEKSTLYLSEPGVPERIMEFDPSMRVIFILRDPTDRIASAFSYLRLQGIEPLSSVLDAVDSEATRLAEGWPAHFGYMKLSSYGDHLDRWFRVVPREQILCLEQSALSDDPSATMRAVESFLDLDHFDRYSFGVRHNPSGSPRSQWLQRLLDVRFPYRSELRRVVPRRLVNAVAATRNRNLERAPGLVPEERAVLVKRLSPQIDIVARLLGAEFVSGWEQA
jgi:hypothetical protein